MIVSRCENSIGKRKLRQRLDSLATRLFNLKGSSPVSEGLAIYCADVGSIRESNFGWARIDSANPKKLKTGTDIAILVEEIANDLVDDTPVALGFECPLWVPVPTDSPKLGQARPGECGEGENRPWSGGPGSAVLTTGLVQVPWILRGLKELASDTHAYLDWPTFKRARKGMFLWEAFVTGSAKGDSHGDDARIGAEAFWEALPDPREANVSKTAEPVLSLVGGAVVTTGWAKDRSLLAEPCLVIKAKASSKQGAS